MLFTLEALKAKHGDALLLHYGSADDPRLIVIDGGPNGVYNQALRPRLEALRKHRTPDDALPIRLLMVSHIDDDHIRGVLDLTSKMAELQEDGKPGQWKIQTLWHNSFDDVVGNHSDEMFRAASAEVGAAAFGDEPPPDLPIRHETALVLASVPQGRTLRNDAKRLGIELNQPIGGLIVAPEQGKKVVKMGDGLTFTILGPNVQRVRELQEDWDKVLEEKGLAQGAEAAAYLDESVYNLASIVVLAELDGRTMLLTGDARGDDTLAGLEAAGILEPGGSMHVDILKLPHHGSDRNVDLDYFQRITADHYIASGDGRHGNPEPETFRLLSEGRGNDEFTIHITYPPEEFKKDFPIDELVAFFEREKAAGKRYEVRFREAGELSLHVDLGEEYDGK